jgi:hypothetical protein
MSRTTDENNKVIIGLVNQLTLVQAADLVNARIALTSVRLYFYICLYLFYFLGFLFFAKTLFLFFVEFSNLVYF